MLDLILSRPWMWRDRGRQLSEPSSFSLTTAATEGVSGPSPLVQVAARMA